MIDWIAIRVVETMRVIFSVLAVVVAVSLATEAGSEDEAKVSFCREEVCITLDPDSVFFEALYCFENRSASPCSQTFFYGFALDSVHLFPDTISVAFGFSDLEYRKAEKGIVFAIQMPGGSCASVLVSYCQCCLEPSFCYRPKTIKVWNEPIEEADFEIRVPPGIELQSVSYEMREVKEEDKVKVYRFTCNKCLPSEDLCLKWLPHP